MGVLFCVLICGGLGDRNCIITVLSRKRDRIYGLIRNMYAENLAKNLRKRRGDEDLRTYAQRLGISKSTLQRIESVEQSTTIKILETITGALKCSTSELLEQVREADAEHK